MPTFSEEAEALQCIGKKLFRNENFSYNTLDLMKKYDFYSH